MVAYSRDLGSWRRWRRAADCSAGVGADSVEEDNLKLILLRTAAHRRNTTSSFRQVLATGQSGASKRENVLWRVCFLGRHSNRHGPSSSTDARVPNCLPSSDTPRSPWSLAPRPCSDYVL